ncbi:sigma-70 family RNA polymerase sigma factor [Brevibacterium sp. ZH18]|uniref:RNA polymerase sigma factor n=1 Tax=Brevibacterium sp. ZH18 TaxID=2927784 RepID=UPI00325B8E30
MDDEQLRTLVPAVIGILRRRGADFAAAEDAVQDALVEAVDTWAADPPRDPRGWLITVAWRKFLDRTRAESARTAREERALSETVNALSISADDTVDLYFLCAHPDLSPASAVALTLRAVGGLTTRQIAEAYMVPESTMAQRISRAKATIAGRRVNRPGTVAEVLTVLYLVFNEGYSGDVDLAAEAIRLTRTLQASINDAEVAGLLALMLIHQARRSARFSPDGALIALADQDRSRWDTTLIAEGIAILQDALARDDVGGGSSRHRPRLPRCTPMPRALRRLTGYRSSAGTTTWWNWATARWPGSIAPWRWVRPTGQRQGWRSCVISTRLCPGILRSRRICVNVPANSRWPLASMHGRRPRRRTAPNVTTSPGRRHD